MTPDIVVTGIRNPSNDVVEVDWLAEPPPPVITLEAADDDALLSNGWSAVATAELAIVEGSLSVTGGPPSRAFRFVGE